MLAAPWQDAETRLRAAGRCAAQRAASCSAMRRLGARRRHASSSSSASSVGVDDLEAHEHRRVAVVVGRGEERVGLALQERLALAEVDDAQHERVGVGAQAAHEAAGDLQRRRAVRRRDLDARKPGADGHDVVPGRHAAKLVGSHPGGEADVRRPSRRTASPRGEDPTVGAAAVGRLALTGGEASRARGRCGGGVLPRA